MAIFKGVATAKRPGGNRKSRKADRSKLCKLRVRVAIVKKQGAR